MAIKSEEIYSILHSIKLIRVDGNLTGKGQSYVFIQDTKAGPHRFSRHKKSSKLLFRGDGSFIFFEGVIAYKVNSQDKYNVSSIVRIYDLYLFDIGNNSRSNSFEKIGDDVILATTSKDPLEVFIRSIL